MIFNSKISYNVIDNFLENKDFVNITNIILGWNFPWKYLESITKTESSSHLHTSQYVHLLYADDEIALNGSNKKNVFDSSYFEKIEEALTKALNVKQWKRVKVNAQSCTDKIYQHSLHKDLDIDCETAVLYLNDNDGYTFFANGEKVESVANRVVKFNSNVWHAGTTCTNAKRRVVLNLNYIPYKGEEEPK